MKTPIGYLPKKGEHSTKSLCERVVRKSVVMMHKRDNLYMIFTLNIGLHEPLKCQENLHLKMSSVYVVC